MKRFDIAWLLLPTALLAPWFLVSRAEADASSPNRTLPAFAKPSATLHFSAQPTEDEIRQARVFEEAFATTGHQHPGNAENRALADALLSVQASRGPGVELDVSSIEQFLATHPASPWSVALRTNLGIEYYRRGSFSKCIAAWRQAWSDGKAETGTAAAALVDRSAGELARMLARIGRMDELDALFTEFGTRQLHGSPAEMAAGAREGLWEMRHHPETSFKCGPYALESILASYDPNHPFHALLSAAASTSRGMSLTQVAQLANQSKLNAQMVRRSGAATIPTPAVVHWKLGHYGALLKAQNGRYLLQDPTFGSSQWISQSVLDEESSGYFLLINHPAAAAGWTPIAPSEGDTVWGKGRPNGSNGNGSGPKDPKKPKPPKKPKKDPCDKGMVQWSAHLMLVSLNLEDTPLGYTPPFGPAINFHVNYDLREANQPASLGYSNLGTRWNLNWITTLTFDSDNAYVHSGEGGTQEFPTFDSGSVVSGLDGMTQSYIQRISPAVYQQVFADGSVNVFDVSDPSGRFYLTKIVDRRRNAVTLSYDASYRLVAITDALGQVSTLSYENASDPLKITKITDPFGRTAQFSYNAANQLVTITDAIGLTSQVTYGSGDDVATLITGYGTTTFASTDAGDGITRSLLVTNPDGSQEMYKSFSPPDNAPEIPPSDPSSTVPQGMATFNNYLQFRNIFYWDRKAMQDAPGAYSSAHIFHFLHNDLSLAMGRILESEKAPLENRVWYAYPGQTLAGFVSSPSMLDQPSAVGRVLDDGTTQLTQYTYNALGNKTSETDPLGRTTYYFYDGNQIDLTAVRHSNAGSSELLVSYTYNSQHLPLTMTDLAGQTTTFTYNAAGQVLTIQDPKGEVTTFDYDGNGYLTSITGLAAGDTGQTFYTYDSVGRVRTLTNALGYARTFAYDNLDRITSITYPDGTQEKFAYTLLDLTKLTDRAGRDINYTYDSLGYLTSETDPLNRTTSYARCRCGALTSLTDALGQQTRWEYDVQGRLIAKVFPDGSRAKTVYEGTTSRIKLTVDARGQTTAFDYNVDDTLALVAFPDAIIPTPTVSLTYDPDYVRVTKIIDGTGTTQFAYLPIGSSPGLGAGQLASTVSALATTTYAYDELSRMISRTINGVTETLTLDGLDRTQSATNALGTFQYEYLGDSSLVTAVSIPNGQTVAQSYFGAIGDFRLQQVLNKRGDGSRLSEWNYTYDVLGNVNGGSEIRDTSTPRTLTPGYDLVSQLTSLAKTNPATTYAYSYDVSANRSKETINGTATTVSYNSLNEVTSSQPPPGSDRTYEWNAAGQLVAINYAGTSNRTEFAYDGLGRRARIVEKSGSTVTGVRQFVWDRLQLVAEFDGTGSMTKRFFEQGIDVVAGPNTGFFYYAKDALGNIREMTDAAGALRARYDYDPYGRRTKLSGDLDADFGFTGHLFHPASGLTLAPFRAYDASQGRWISRDPAGESESFNLFAYVSNNPLNLVDPDGRGGGGAGGVAKNLLAPELQLGIIILRKHIATLQNTRADLYNILRQLQRGKGKICPKERAAEIARLKARLDELESYINFDQSEIQVFEKALEGLSYLP